MTKTMMKCPMTKTMMICPITKIMMICPMTMTMPNEYANDNEMAITEVKYDRNMTNDELKDVGTKYMVLYKRDDNRITKVKWPIETSDIDDEFMREYDNMHKSMEHRQINDFYEGWGHI